MGAFVKASCRRTLIRLETAANQTTLKKASEMASQLVLGHECYRPHETWTVFCKSLVWVAHRASRRIQDLQRGVLQGTGSPRLARPHVRLDPPLHVIAYIAQTIQWHVR